MDELQFCTVNLKGLYILVSSVESRDRSNPASNLRNSGLIASAVRSSKKSDCKGGGINVQ